MSFSPANSQIANRLYPAASGVVDNNGNLEIDFPSPALGKMWTGGVTVLDSPQGIFWDVYVSGVRVDKTSGNSTCSSLQVAHPDQLVIKNSDNQSLFLQIGQTIHATFAVVESPADNTALIAPGHDILFPPPTALAPPLALVHQEIGISLSTSPITIPIVPPQCACMLGFIQIIGLAQDVECNIIADGLFPGGSNRQFWKQANDVYPTWWTLPPNINSVTLQAAGATVAAFSLWASQVIDPRDFIPPFVINTTSNNILPFQTISGVGFTSFNPFGLNGDEGTLMAEGYSGATGPLGPEVVVELQYYLGSSSWVTIGAVSIGPNPQADTKVVKTPPGSGRLRVLVTTAVSPAIGAAFIQ